MPNGRVGGVPIPREALKHFFDSIPGDPIMGAIEGQGVALAHVRQLLESTPDARIFVEGQHDEAGTAIVIHFRPGGGERWLWVAKEQPGFELLKAFWSD